MRANINFWLAAVVLIIACTFLSSPLAAGNSNVPQPVDVPSLFVIPQNMEQEIAEVLPDDLELAGGYGIGDINIEESTILVEFRNAAGQIIKIRLGHPDQLDEAYTATDKFALRLETGDTNQFKTTLDDLATHIASVEKNWKWTTAMSKVENRGDIKEAVNGVVPECADPLQKTAVEASAITAQGDLLKIYEKNKTGRAYCDCWLFIEILNKANMSIADQIEKIADGMISNSNYNSILLSLGMYFRRNSELSRAMNTWRKLAEAYPSYTEAALPLARVTVMIGYKDDEITRYEERLRKNPADRNSEIILGVLKYYKRNYAGALPHFQRGVTFDNISSDIKIFLTMTYFYLGRVGEAQRLIDEEMKDPKHSNKIYYCQAMLQIGKDRNKAMENLTKFIESHGVKVDDATKRDVLDVKEAWELLDYLRNWREDMGVDILAPLDMQEPWPVINVITNAAWVQEPK